MGVFPRRRRPVLDQYLPLVPQAALSFDGALLLSAQQLVNSLLQTRFPSCATVVDTEQLPG